MDATRSSSTVDGNAIAGILIDILGADVTGRTATCAGCGTEAYIAQAVVELDRRIAIVRCRACTRTLFTLLYAQARPRIVFGALRAMSG